ncbi:hypothetical protein AB6A23_08770 [Paenibacillus tarimensis]
MFKKKTAIYLSMIIVLLLIIYNEYKTVWISELFESRIEDNKVFLSDDYFYELDEIFEQVKLENEKWYIFEGSNKIAAKVVITKMMMDLESNPTALQNHENFHRYFETFDKNIRKLNSITEEMHFFRNTLNTFSGAPVRLDPMITLAAEGKWKLFSAKYHRFNYEGVNGALNVKFISIDGRFEAVYNTGTGEIVSDPVNMGTYNYAPGSINPIEYYKHYTFDKVPWKKWGNVNGVSYKDIMSLESKHGSVEAKNNIKKIERLIEQRKVE